MGRDFEISSYFPHVALDDRLVRRLFRRLAGEGLQLGSLDVDPYPVLDYLQPLRGGGARIVGGEPEQVLRARTGQVPRGYGVIPLIGSGTQGAVQVPVSLRFETRSARYPQLDGVHVRVGDAGLRLPRERPDDPVGPGWRSLLGWYGGLCEELKVAYGFGDWEDNFLQSAIPPSRADVLAGRVTRLFRLNCFGPALAESIGRPQLSATPAQAVVRLRYGGVLVGCGLEYTGGGGELFGQAARHLRLSGRNGDFFPTDG